MIYIGVDPGLSGGCAAIDTVTKEITGFPMPTSGGEVDARALGCWVYGLLVRADFKVIATVEKVHSMPKQGVASTFKFGLGYGKVLGVLGAYAVRTELVIPQTWKKVVLAGTKGDKDAAIEWVGRATGVVLIQPKCRTPHDGVADAVCIAEYGVRTFK